MRITRVTVQVEATGWTPQQATGLARAALRALADELHERPVEVDPARARVGRLEVTVQAEPRTPDQEPSRVVEDVARAVSGALVLRVGR